MTRLRLAVLVTLLISVMVVPASPVGADAPTNDTLAGAIEIDPGALPYTNTQDTSDATTDADDDQAAGPCDPPAVDASVWYTFTPTEDGFLNVEVFNSSYTAGVIVASGSPGALAFENCGPDSLSLPVDAGVTYYILAFDDQVDGEGNGGELVIKVSVQEILFPGVFCGPPGAERPATIVGSGLIKGTPGDDVIVGSDSNDRIFGFGGDDWICGEHGNDLLDGGAGNDLLIGDGDDLPPFAESDGNNNDRLFGGPGNDELIGLGGDDYLNGNGGDDVIIGFGGEDTGHGGPGNDVLIGGPHDDRLHGEGGNDELIGNYGSDLLNGGAGDDFMNGDPPNAGGPPPPFPPGGNDDTCVSNAGNDIIENCETIL